MLRLPIVSRSGSCSFNSPILRVAHLVDRSGSMQQTIEIVKNSVAILDDDINDSFVDILYALYAFGQVENSGAPVKLTDFVPFNIFYPILQSLVAWGGLEPGFKTIVESSNNLSWPSNALKISLMWTDEPNRPAPDVTETQEDAIASLLSKGITYSYGFSYFDDYQGVADATGGVLFNNTETIVEDLKQQLGKPLC